MLSPTNPRTRSSQEIAASIKSKVINILLTTPDSSRFYEQALAADGFNPNQIKILTERCEKLRGLYMSTQTNIRTCTHIKVTGVRCGSPTLRGEQFCYFHQRMARGVKMPPKSRLHPIALIEDEESIQASLMEVINALARNAIDLKRAELILRALHIAVKNAHRVRFGANSQNMVKEVPDYQPASPNIAVGKGDPGIAHSNGTADAPVRRNLDITSDVEARAGISRETAADAMDPSAPTAEDSQLNLPGEAIIPAPRELSKAALRRVAKAQAESDRRAAIREALVRASKTVVTPKSVASHLPRPSGVHNSEPNRKPPAAASDARTAAAHRATV